MAKIIKGLDEQIGYSVKAITVNAEKVKLGDVCTFLSKSKRLASFGSERGNYQFYSSSEKVKWCDVADYNEEAVIIGTGGKANVKISSNFSCSADNFIVKSNNILNKYIFYYLHQNINVLERLFHGTTIKHLTKEGLINVEIPKISNEKQQELVFIL